MKRAKTIDEIFQEVRGYDLVMTNDAALATALNARIEDPVVGFFAMTPKQIGAIVAADIFPKGIVGELKAISIVCEETGMSPKHVHSEINNIMEIRERTADISGNIFTRSARQVFNSFDKIDTLQRAMSGFDPDKSDFFKGKRVAAVCVDWFNDLDKHFLPFEYDPIDLYTDSDFGIDTVYCIGNDRQIAESVASIIPPDDAEDYAIVLDSTSPLTEAFRCAFYRRGIPFINSMGVRDLSQIRDFLQFISLSLTYDTLRVKHVRELFSNFNSKINESKDKYLLCKLTDDELSPSARKLRDLMAGIRSHSFLEAADILWPAGQPQVRMVLDEMGMQDEAVSTQGVNWLSYAIDNISELEHNEQIPEYERKGVLLADVNRSVYVDRPVVIFAGMGTEWDLKIRSQKYIDMERESEIAAEKLSVLLQQGSRRIYCANIAKGGKPARPCLTFDSMLSKPCNTFGDICDDIVEGPWVAERAATMPQHGAVEISEDALDDAFSKTSFNKFKSCPMAYFFARFLPSADNERSAFGELIHMFAELYVCYPEAVRQKGLDYFVGLVSGSYSGLSSPLMEEVDTDKIRLAMANTMAYIDTLGISGQPMNVNNGERKHPNIFIEAIGEELSSSICETEDKMTRFPIHGHFDLFWDGTVVDYKTGTPKTAQDLCNLMNLSKKQEFGPEFQPLIYLALAMADGSPGRFRQFYALDNDTESLSGNYDITRSVRCVDVVDKDLKEIMRTDDGLREALHDMLKKEYKDSAGAILEALADSAEGDPSTWKGQSAVINALKQRAGVDDKYIDTSIGYVQTLVGSGMVVYDGHIKVPKAYLCAFMADLAEAHEAARSMSLNGFVVNPRIDCAKCDYCTACTSAGVQGGDEDESE